jgi:outer membrane receptor protein involved in Fe transport
MRVRFFLFLLTVTVTCAFSQSKKVTVSGTVLDGKSGGTLPYVNAVIKKAADSTFVGGTVTNDQGLFSIGGIPPGDYVLEVSFVGFKTNKTSFLVGRLSDFLDLGKMNLNEDATALEEVVVKGQQDAVAESMEKKTFRMDENVNQSGGSILQAMKNLPGVTVSQEGTVRLRGSDRVAVLVDGKQTALTGFGTQQSLDNIPASAVEKIEVINNPGAKYDANGNAGIINIIYKKEVKEGFNGKVGMAAGVGALWIKKENYPGIRPQYEDTPKINPSLSLNYRKKRSNIFLQVDDLYTHTLNKNEFTDRFYDTGDTVRQQLKRNRRTNVVTGKGGIDLYIDDRNTFAFSALFSSEKILDDGDEPFYNGDFSEQLRLWQFLEDELKTTVTASASWQHKYLQPGRVLNLAYNYTFHREDEKYFFTNTMPTYVGEDSFKLISDEQVSDVTLDYVHPLKHGRFETGLKFRYRDIPTDMTFYPGLNSPLDVNAGGKADYRELIPAAYGNYVFESRNLEVEAGLRVEYADIKYTVDPNHPVYKSDGYSYAQPFPNLRFAYKLNDRNTLSLFYTRRVDRPNEVDIRVFPKYDDAEIIKVGNPGLHPQFTTSYELGYKANTDNGYLYAAAYYKPTEGTITRIASIQPGSTLIYNIFQNAGNSHMAGLEIILSHNAGKWATFNLNLNGYQSVIDSFTVVNKYPAENTFSAGRQETFSGSVKLNGLFHLPKQVDFQLSVVYAAPDVVPQGKTYSRFYIDAGAKKAIQRGRGEVFVNASDLANTLRIKREVHGQGFSYNSTDYLETQVVRVGYNYKF